MFGIMAALLVMTSMITAFGVSSPYWEGNPMSIARGETRIVNLNLQNMVGDEDVTVEAKLIEGAEITNLDDGEYTIPSKTSNIMIPLEVSMPKDVSPGETKTVKVDFKTVNGDQGGIAMGTGMSIVFDVVASEDVESNTAMIVTIILAIAVLALILWILNKKKKK